MSGLLLGLATNDTADTPAPAPSSGIELGALESTAFLVAILTMFVHMFMFSGNGFPRSCASPVISSVVSTLFGLALFGMWDGLGVTDFWSVLFFSVAESIVFFILVGNVLILVLGCRGVLVAYPPRRMEKYWALVRRLLAPRVREDLVWQYANPAARPPPPPAPPAAESEAPAAVDAEPPPEVFEQHMSRRMRSTARNEVLMEDLAERGPDIAAVLDNADSWKERARLLFRNVKPWCCARWVRLRKACRTRPTRHARFETRADFFFPQRLFLAFVICIYAIILLTVLVIRGAMEAVEFWDSMANSFFIPNGLGRSDSDLIHRAILGAGVGSPVVAAVLMMGMWYTVFSKYREDIMGMRQGRYFFNPKDHMITSASNYVAYQICHTVVAFMLVLILFLIIGLFIGVLALWPSIRDAIFWGIWDMFKTFILGAGLLLIARMIAIRLFFLRRGMINNRRWFGVVDYWLLYLNLLTGVVACGKRFLLALVFQLVYFWRLDVSSFPRGRESWDSGHSAYIGMLMMDHQYNNPAFCVAAAVFAARLADMSGESPTEGSALLRPDEERPVTRRRISPRAYARWGIAYTLFHNPVLMAHRKQRLDT